MKKNSFVLTAIFLLTIGWLPVFAQNNVHQGSPSSFMYLQGQPWVETKYGTTWNQAANTCTQGLTTTTDGSGYHSHAFVKALNGNSALECSSCFGYGTNYSFHANIMAPAWDGSGGYVDTVIQMGDRYTSSGHGTKCQEIIYTFIPDTINPVLLLNYMSVLQNKISGGHDFAGNPRIEISVTNAQGSLLPLGYYPNDYYTGYQPTSNGTSQSLTYNVNRPINGNFGPHGRWTSDFNDNVNFQPNTGWPYAQYVFAAPGCGGSAYTQMTPCWVDEENFSPQVCPRTYWAQQAPSSCMSQSSDVESIVSYPYTIVAFDLTNQARAGQIVKLKIRKTGCLYTAHWAEIYFTAKMVPGKVEADVCNCDTLIKFNVPWGFKNYQWCYGLHEDSVRYLIDNSTRELILDRSDPNTRIWPYYCCVMESWTGVPFVYKANLKIYDLAPDIRIEQVNKHTCSYNFIFRDSSIVNMYVPALDANNQPTGQYDTTRMTHWNRKWLCKDPNGNIQTFGGVYNDTAKTFELSLTPSQVAQYRQIAISISDLNNKCYNSDTIWVDLDYDPTYLDSVVTVDTIITCEERYVYDPGTFGDFYTWTSPGTRTVRYENAAWNGCDSLVKVTYIIQKPHINQLLYTDEYCDEFSTTLYADANMIPEHYQWRYSYQGDTTFEETVDPTAERITITKPGTYSLTIGDTSGCTASAEITIDPCKPFINMPNTITPSKPDGLNDCIEVVQRDLLESLEFTVYTREGEVVYHTTDKDFCWDGKVDGKLYTNVMYVYVLRVKDYNNQSSMYKGTVLVL